MNILISGGTGFIGTALCSHLLKKGHHLTVKSRQPEVLNPQIKGIRTLSQLSTEDHFDIAINLAGEPIANKRWSKGQKRKIFESRLEITEEFITFFKGATHKPTLFISGSAIGYYGTEETNEGINEDGSGDDSFSSDLCAKWEAVAMKAEPLGVRTCLLRTGIVLGHNGGALGKMLSPFKLGLGGKIGSGKQWMSWIHLSDLIGIIDYCIAEEHLKGPINCTAPSPVTNTFFTKTLGKHLKRPTVFRLPAFAIQILMGEMGEELLLAGKKVLPSKIQQAGYQFGYECLETALTDVLKNT